jgi:hypothetical protein
LDKLDFNFEGCVSNQQHTVLILLIFEKWREGQSQNIPYITGTIFKGVDGYPCSNIGGGGKINTNRVWQSQPMMPMRRKIIK